MHLFFLADITEGSITLPEEESRHAVKVLRLGEGDIIHIIDGTGGFYKAEITDAHPKHCTARILSAEKDFGKRSHFLHIAIAPTKSNDRTEWFVEKATEAGIDRISLIDCHNSERSVIKKDRLQKVAVSAIKQSLKAYLPEISEMMAFGKFLDSMKDFKGQKFIAHCQSPLEEHTHIRHLYKKGEPALVLIGPEGDFTAAEVNAAKDAGFREAGLGKSRLRTETAALYACMAINILNE